jgi:hypothetical protein
MSLEVSFCPSTEKCPPVPGSTRKETGTIVRESLHHGVPTFTENATGRREEVVLAVVEAVPPEPATKLFSAELVSSPEVFLETVL